MNQLLFHNNRITNEITSSVHLLNEDHKRFNSNVNNLENNNKIISNIPLNYKQAISRRDRNH